MELLSRTYLKDITEEVMILNRSITAYHPTIPKVMKEEGVKVIDDVQFSLPHFACSFHECAVEETHKNFVIKFIY